MISKAANTLSQYGYAFIGHHRPEAPSYDAISDFGEIEAVEDLDAVQHLIPRKQCDYPPNTYSGNFGLGEFPLHTDLAHWAIPPRYLALRCIRGAASVGTRLFDGHTLIKEFGIDRLRTILVQPRRPMRNSKQLIRILDRITASNEFRLRWDSIYLKPASGLSSEIYPDLIKYLMGVEPKEIFLLETGDTLIIDNWRYLHGRTSVDHKAKDRQIDRAYLGKIL